MNPNGSFSSFYSTDLLNRYENSVLYTIEEPQDQY